MTGSKKDISLDDDHMQFKLILKEAQELRYKKLQCYGKTYADFGILGLVIKVNDKCGRIKQLMKHPDINDIAQVESLRDSAIDLLNYAAMLVMMIDNDRRKNN